MKSATEVPAGSVGGTGWAHAWVAAGAKRARCARCPATVGPNSAPELVGELCPAANPPAVSPLGWPEAGPGKAAPPRRGRYLIPCPGEAHRNPHIDNCGLCAPRGGWMEVDRGGAVAAIAEDVAVWEYHAHNPGHGGEWVRVPMSLAIPEAEVSLPGSEDPAAFDDPEAAARSLAVFVASGDDDVRITVGARRKVLRRTMSHSLMVLFAGFECDWGRLEERLTVKGAHAGIEDLLSEVKGLWDAQLVKVVETIGEVL